MTRNQKLELTWIGKENRQHDRAPGESVRHRARVAGSRAVLCLS